MLTQICETLETLFPEATDKELHFIIAGILGAFIFAILDIYRKSSLGSTWVLGAAVTFLYGLCFECWQGMTGKTFEWGDILANLLGYTVGSFGYIFLVVFWLLVTIGILNIREGKSNARSRKNR